MTQRKDEVRTALAKLNAGLLKGTIRAVVSKATGAIAFSGWLESDRGRVSDACGFRLLMSTGSALVKAEIAKAEQLAGRSVNKQALAQGIHSHNGGVDWHHGH
jgi:hypothetical protein